MASPKKDVFADLFQLAAGPSCSQGDNQSMTNLALKQPRARNQASVRPDWGNLDVLLPDNAANVSRKTTPLVSNPNSASLNDSLSLMGLHERQPAVSTKRSSKARPAEQWRGDSLLDDEFTDLFVASVPIAASSKARIYSSHSLSQPTPTRLQPQESGLRDNSPNPHTVGANLTSTAPKIRPGSQETRAKSPTLYGNSSSRNGSPAFSNRHQRSQNGSQSVKNDELIATLVDIGLSVEDAIEAIERVGPDLQDCVNYVITKSQRCESRNTGLLPGLNVSDVSNRLFNTASRLLDKSKKQVICGIGTLQQHYLNNQTSDGTLLWMKSQHKYKGSAIEGKNGEQLEDYGTDDENIDAEEIQRIISAQRQRERERRRERLAAVKPLSRSGDTNTPNLPQRPITRELMHRDCANNQKKLGTPENAPSSSFPQPQSTQSSARKTTETGATTTAITESVDLLGLQTEPHSQSNAEKFKGTSASGTSDAYNLPARRSRSLTPRAATSETLNAFQQSDYDTAKAKGAEAFSRGDFHNALEAYTKCLNSVPEKHELRIVITANLALIAIKLGNYRLAKERCDEGLSLVGEVSAYPNWFINDKGIKYWLFKLLMRKAKSLELIEQFPEALECYMLLISKYGVTEPKVIEAKCRISNIVNPPKLQPKRKFSAPVAPSSTTGVQSEQLNRIKKQHAKEKRDEELKFQLHDQVNQKTQEWSRGNEGNIRALLISLGDVLPQRLGFPFITSKLITMNDLMLTKKVKINYMKVISCIHPDKLEHLAVEDKMICQQVFVTLNKAWEEFKVQNQIA